MTAVMSPVLGSNEAVTLPCASGSPGTGAGFADASDNAAICSRSSAIISAADFTGEGVDFAGVDFTADLVTVCNMGTHSLWRYTPVFVPGSARRLAVVANDTQNDALFGSRLQVEQPKNIVRLHDINFGVRLHEIQGC